MAVSHDASSESHTGTTGSVSEASFTWNHAGAASGVKGALVFTFNTTSDTPDEVSAVTYGGVSMTAVSGGRATDTVGEKGDCKAWFLGASVPQGTQAVVVTRTNSTNEHYAVVATQLAATDLEVYTAGIVLLQENGTLAEQSVDDGSPGTNSLRYAGLHSGLSTPPSVGSSSTAMEDIDFGVRIVVTAVETTAGQGARNVGFSTGTSDDRAGVHLAVREVAGGTINLAGTIAGVSMVTPDMDTIVLFTRAICSTVPRIG